MIDFPCMSLICLHPLQASTDSCCPKAYPTLHFLLLLKVHTLSHILTIWLAQGPQAKILLTSMTVQRLRYLPHRSQGERPNLILSKVKFFTTGPNKCVAMLFYLTFFKATAISIAQSKAYWLWLFLIPAHGVDG